MNPSSLREELRQLRRRRQMLLELNPDADVYELDERIEDLERKLSDIQRAHGNLVTRDVQIDPS